MKVVKSKLLAEICDLRSGFVIAGKNVNILAARLKNLAAFLEAAGPVDQIAGRKIIVGIDGHQTFESLMVAVYIGKNEQLQGPMIAREAARSGLLGLGNQDAFRA